ncbi:Transcriptional regulator MraZ [Candidatus Bilamarchaeum dharawalense]|uniref:Transcriptional regulator MraZ n=1 Tax=Candidatus Bilamarchaeum dharawalense TaxID=2885759 RepID=A0A5E4LPW1_9ARCH|nr:Transcriptional regulator MraZ [Candidatus Bilamarchaeum dharawalense]
MKIEKTNLDSKGRALIPKSFREAIGLRENDPVFVSLDDANNALILSQYSEKNLFQITITMNDKPGTLAWLATVLYENSFDLIVTESHSVLRTKGAVWRVIGAFKEKYDVVKLRKKLLSKGATVVSIKKL